MEVLSPTKKHAAGALEMVSEEEEEEAAVDSEHEEGEICSEEEEEEEAQNVSCASVFQLSNYASNSASSYPPHFSFSDHRPSKKSSPVTSEVIIYDDSGRTAIFTSPTKPRVSSYPRRGEASRQHARESLRRKEKEGERSRRYHMGSSSQAAQDKWSKAVPRRSAVESKGAGVSQEGRPRPHKAKVKVSEVRGGHRPRRSRASTPDSSSRSSSCSSCSSSYSSSSVSCSLSEEEVEVTSVSHHKGRGKENRRCGPTSKTHDRTVPLEYGCEPPPVKGSSKAAHHSKHTSSQHRPPTPHPRSDQRHSSHHNSHRSPKETVARKSTHQHKSPKTKGSERKESSKPERPVKELESVVSKVKGQSWLPRGSLGEMLLSRPKPPSTHSTPAPQDVTQPPVEDTKTSGSLVKPKKQEEEVKVVEEVVLEPRASSEAGDNLTLDQEDDEELQLRLIAIQSSLRLLTDMQKEGQMQEKVEEEEEASTSTPFTRTGVEDEAHSSTLKDFPSLREPRTPPVKDAEGHRSSTSPSRPGQDVSQAKTTHGEDESVILVSDDVISISSSTASELGTENLATNRSYLEAAEAKGAGGKAAEDCRRKVKEQLDVDQDPVDMEICNSSGEEEGQVGLVQDSPLSPEPGQDTGTATGGEGGAWLGEGPGGLSGGNFQFPVEWAYMMPPPPPPDQPANDLQNIDSWCFDQNMYLQAMQVATPGEEQQQQQHQHQQQQQQQGQAKAEPAMEWPAPATDTPQPHTSSWPGPFLESYNTTTTLPQDTPTPLTLPSGPHPDHHHHQQQEEHHHQQQQQQQTYPYSESTLPLDASSTGHSSDLKDMPAEQYQAFMSAVLQQQPPSPKGQTSAAAAFSECPQRNLILVPLNGSHQPTAATKTSKKVKAKKLRVKRQLRKKQVLQECSNSSGSGKQQVTSGSAEAVVVEEEDEDLLRAQLLIDMSRKKKQRQLGASTSTSTSLPAALSVSSSLALVSRATGVAREGQQGRASPQGVVQATEAPAVARSVRVVKGRSGLPRSGESSPTHSFRSEARQGLSDIGGWGLDPKGSKFNYHSTQQDLPHANTSSSGGVDVPKVKFPAIQPVIISLQSDSDDSDSDGSAATMAASEPMSQSIDILLKSVRYASMASTSKDPGPSSPKPGPSTSAPPAGPSTPSPDPQTRQVADSTPQAVRHLSRHQQEEYRWLKEQLRKKEMLQRKKMQQRPGRVQPLPKHPLQPPPPPPPPQITPSTAESSASPDITPSPSPSGGASPVYSDPSLGLSSGSETSPAARAVTWKDMGLLQIQVANDSAVDASSESRDSGLKGREAQGDSSANASAVEDEDEETLRMMALLTQKKKKTTESPSEIQQQRVVVEEQTKTLENAKDTEDGLDDSRSEDQSYEGLRGEWMVVDEVREEGAEPGEEELCIRPPGTPGEEDECGEGSEISDGVESVTMSPGTEALTGGPSGKKTEVQPTDKASKTNKNSARKHDSMQDGEANQNTATTNVPSEGLAATHHNKETKQDIPLKPDASQTTEPSCSEKIKEVIRRIETKTREAREKASRESSPAEANKGGIASQGSGKKQAVLHQPNHKEETEPQQTNKPQLTNGTEKTNITQVKTTTTTATTTTTTTTTTTAAAAPAGQNQGRVVVSKQNEGKGTHQRTVIATTTQKAMVVRKVKVVRPTGNAVGQGKVAAPTTHSATVVGTAATVTFTTAATTAVTASTTSVTTASTQDSLKSSKGHLQLKKLEKEYKEKKNGINKMITKLGQLLKEVNEEQQQRQDLKNGIAELQAKLREMESQLESKSSAVQTKMELIRHIQVQLGSERQALSRVEHQGEKLGQQVYGTGFNFTKSVTLSPRSKVKDITTKKNLATSIYALHQQVRDLTNKRKNTTKSSSPTTSENGVLRKVITPEHQTKTSNTTITSPATIESRLVRQATPDNTTKITTTSITTPTIESGVVRRQATPDNTTKITSITTTTPTFESVVLGKQVTPDNSKINTSNTTETGIVRKQATPKNTIKSNTTTTTTNNTTDTRVVRNEATPGNTTPNTTEEGMVKKQNMTDKTTTTTTRQTPQHTNNTSNTTTTPTPNTTTATTLQHTTDATSSTEKLTLQTQAKNTTTATTGDRTATQPPLGKPPVKRKASPQGAASLKIPRVLVLAEKGGLGGVKGGATGRLASQPIRAVANGTEGRETLDEMKALCPHDLLGRCNDTSCQYQHLPSLCTSPQQPHTPPSQLPKITSKGGAVGDEVSAAATSTTSSSTSATQGKAVQKGTSQVKVVSRGSVVNKGSNEEVMLQVPHDGNTELLHTTTDTLTTPPTDTTDTSTTTTTHKHTSYRQTDSRESSATASLAPSVDTLTNKTTVTETDTHTETTTAGPETVSQQTLENTDTEPTTTDTQTDSEPATTENTDTQTGTELTTTDTETNTAPEITNTQTRQPANDTELGKETNVTKRPSNAFNVNITNEDLTQAPQPPPTTTTQTNKRRSSKTHTRAPKRRSSTRRSTDKSGEESAPTQSEAESVTEHREETRVTRKSLRARRTTTPKMSKSTPPPKTNAKSSPGRGQKRKLRCKEPSSKR